MSYNSPFSVAGMSSSTSGHTHSQNWGTSNSNPLSTSFSDSLSRSHYQPGYMMSASQANNMASSQRVDEVPVVQTKAKMNQGLNRGAASEFGMESMFKSSRQRQNLADEDAPPTTSVNDIPNETYSEANSSRFQPRSSTRTVSQLRQSHSRSNSQSSQTLYVVVFGYPPDKYSVTVEYFKSLGDCTEAEPNTEITNCFRIGFRDAGDAMRAVRKNGEVFGGSWMVGVKWADSAQAEALLGSMNLRNTIGLSGGNNQLMSPSDVSSSGGGPMAVDESPHHSNVSTPTVGTPIKLAPSASAFRRPGSGISAKGAVGGTAPTALASASSGLSNSAPAQAASKGVLGQVSDMIFGW